MIIQPLAKPAQDVHCFTFLDAMAVQLSDLIHSVGICDYQKSSMQILISIKRLYWLTQAVFLNCDSVNAYFNHQKFTLQHVQQAKIKLLRQVTARSSVNFHTDYTIYSTDYIGKIVLNLTLIETITYRNFS